MAPLSNLAAHDVESTGPSHINLASFRETGPLVIERGEGVYISVTHRKRYPEGMAGLWCTALGYGNERTGRGRRFADAQAFVRAPVQRPEPRSGDRAAEKLKELAPVPISKVFFCNSGSEANDTQIKLVWI